MSSLPKSRVILGFNDFFPGTDLPDRLELIRGMSKKDLMMEISGLNYRLKPNDRKRNDYAVASQDRELYYFCGGAQSLYRKYGDLARRFVKGKDDYPLIFTRQTCLFALEEILHSDIPVVDEFRMPGSWENLLQYLLAVNTEVAKVRKDNRDETTDDEKSDNVADGKAAPLTFEDINSKIIVLNELNLGSDQLYVPYRAFLFLEYLTNHEKLGHFAKRYIQEKFGASYPKFVFDIMSLYIGNNPDKQNNITNAAIGFELDTTHVYYSKESTMPLFLELSQVIPNNNSEKLLSIRKYPFYNAGNAFYLMDNTMLLEKCYSQFINDFWFDLVKEVKDGNDKAVFNIKYYRAAVGAFFETYVDQSFRFMIGNTKHYKIKTLNELLLNVHGQEVEYTDVYIRYTNKIFIGEAKATGLYDKEKYSADLNEFYKGGREAFFDSFGMKQIVNSTKKLLELAPDFDQGFPDRGTIKLYPAVIVNEKALQTPIMAQVFNNRFKELIKGFDAGRVKIAPLAIIHVSDLENIEETVNRSPNVLWSLLQRHGANPQFMPPFYHTVNVSRVKPNYTKPEKLYYQLIGQFSVEGE